MKKKVVTVLLAFLLSVVAIIPAFTESKNGKNGYNVVIAMDASGSLNATDPSNYRLSAVDLFVHLLAKDNNTLGSLSFSNDVLDQKKLTAITKESDKQVVLDSLSSTAETEVPKSGWTNIGSALNCAVNDIIQNGDSSLPSVVLLLSDGNTELPTDKETQVSLDLKADAVQAARDHHIAIYSVCLNANGHADKKEMEQISKATGGKSIEIKKAEDLQDALTTFYSMIYGTSVEQIFDDTFDSTGKVTKSFSVPGTGVEEINVIIYGKAKDIVVSKPDNSTAQCEKIEAETFSFLKIADIVPGEWEVTLSGVPGDRIKVDLLFNTDLTVVTNIEPNQDSFNPEDTLTFEALLYGSNSTTGGSTNGYDATLRLRDSYGDIIKELPMNAENNRFLVTTQLEEGNYKYSVVVKGFNIIKESEIKGSIKISSDVTSKEESENTPPVAVENPVEVKLNLWPFKDNSYSMDVSGLATDNQDEPLEYRIESSSFIEGDDYLFDGKTLKMNNFSLSKGEFLINAYDKFGANCQITVHVITRNIGLITVILLAVIAFVVVLALIILWWILIHKPFMGEITVTNINGYQSQTQRKSRGNIKMSAFLIGSTGMNGKAYFQATGKDYIFFVSKTPVECDSVIGKNKKIKIQNNFDVRIYSDTTHENGIEVRFHSFKY